jgi:hypothetical protein
MNGYSSRNLKLVAARRKSDYPYWLSPLNFIKSTIICDCTIYPYFNFSFSITASSTSVLLQ